MVSGFLDGQNDPNTIIDIGCPRSIGGEESARALCKSLGISFVLEEMKCEPFIHGCGKCCSDPGITIGKWCLLITDLNGIELKIPFYITKGDGSILHGNDRIHKSYLCSADNFLITSVYICSLPNGEA